MFRATLKNGNGNQLISASDIHSDAEYRSEYRGHLFCPKAGCPARVIWVDRQGSPYFRTWPGSKHAENCPHAYETDPSKIAEQATEAFPVRLSREHIQRCLKTSHRKQKEDDGLLPKKEPSDSQSKRKHPAARSGGMRLVPTTDKTAPVEKKGTRQSSVFQRNSSQLRTKDNGKSLCVRGRVINAEVQERSVHLFLDAGENPAVDISFYEAFRTDSQQAYELISDIAQRLHSGTISPFRLSCVGECRIRDGRYHIQVFHEEDFTLDEHSLSSFYATLPQSPKRRPRPSGSDNSSVFPQHP